MLVDGHAEAERPVRVRRHLAGEVCRSIIDWVSETAPYGVERGGYLFGHQPLRSSGGLPDSRYLITEPRKAYRFNSGDWHNRTA